ncbi:MAG: hypothetical protein GSR80_000016 [Desulfurococcales archaeon]|nr:hypothetical protein [Desulfurococcales archaeon]
MSDYIQKVIEAVRPKLSEYGLKLLPRGKNSFSLIRGTTIVMTVRDAGEIVELSYKSKKYTYDKWYTKPEHLTAMILNVLEHQEKQQ